MGFWSRKTVQYGLVMIQCMYGMLMFPGPLINVGSWKYVDDVAGRLVVCRNQVWWC